MDKIGVKVEDKKMSVVGSDFRTMLDVVRGFEDRVWQPQSKLWQLSQTADEVRDTLAAKGLQLVGEDELLDHEIEDIKRVQGVVLDSKEWIMRKISSLSEEIDRYSYNSKSRIKGGLCYSRSLLDWALEYAAVPVEKLTELQVGTLYKAYNSYLKDLTTMSYYANPQSDLPSPFRRKRVLFYALGLKIYGQIPYILSRRLRARFISNQIGFMGGRLAFPSGEENWTAVPYQQKPEVAEMLFAWLKEDAGFEWGIAREWDDDIHAPNAWRTPPHTWVPGIEGMKEGFQRVLGGEDAQPILLPLLAEEHRADMDG